MYNTGKVKTNLQYAVNLESLGFFSFHTRCAFDIMGKLIRAGDDEKSDVPSGALIAPIDWNTVTSRIKVASLSSMSRYVFLVILSLSFVYLLSCSSQEDSGDTSAKQDLASRIRGLDDNAAQSEVQGSVCKAISEVMGTKPDYDLRIL